MKKDTAVIIRNAAAYDFGGGERFPVFLANSVSTSFDPIIISASQQLLRFARSHNVKTVEGKWWSQQNWSGWRMSLFPIYLLWQIFVTFWYTALFRQLKPSVVHIQSKDDFISATIAARIVGSTIIWTDHADLKHIWLNVEKPMRNFVGKTVLWAANFADAITVVSHSEKKLVSANLLSSNKIIEKLRIVHNGVIDSYEKYPRKKSKGSYVFCVASRMVSDKGIDEIIAAFSMVRKSHSNAQLILMGDGPEAERFKESASRIEGISFLGHIDQPLEIMAQSDAFVHATYHEGFSVALVEASMMGLPIIATNVGGNPEIIHHEQTGILIPSKNSGALAEAMERLISDEKLSAELGKNARKQFLDEFEFESIVKNSFLPLYNK